MVQALPHIDRDKPNLFTFSSTVSKASCRILLSISASCRYQLYLRDVSEAFVSSEFDLLRDAFIIPPKELNLPANVLWRLKKPLYGLPESVLLWYETYRQHHEHRLKMQPAVSDPCLCYTRSQTALEGIVCVQVDDSAITGTDRFLAAEEKLRESFPQRDVGSLVMMVSCSMGVH